MDETAFYIPCLEEDEECVEIIHGIEFGQEDNFFRLHNEEDIEASVNYNDFNAGKLLFKWDRTSDVDLDSSIATISTTIDVNKIKDKIRSLGFKIND